MSAGVSDQRMKGQGNQVPNVPKDHIESGEDFESWRHQPPNHGPSYVPITTTTDPYNTAYYNSSGAAAAQFQYPPFGVGDGTWSSGNENLTILSGYGHDNYSVDGMFGPSFGQPSTYNYFPGNGDYNTWGTTQQVNAAAAARKSGINYDDYYREQNNYPQVHDGLKNVEQGIQGLGLDVVSTLQQQQQHDKEHSTNSNQISGTNSNTVSKQEHPKEKKMTWASIASQPAKPQVSTITSTVKKKGPGMPPPPMIPGKHNMDIGTWDSPSKNGSSMLVPQPPPVITAPPPTIVPSPLSQTKLIPQQQQQNVSTHQQQQQMSHQQLPHPNMGRQHPGAAAPGSHNQINVRPNWPAPGDNRQAQPLPPGGMMQQQQQRPNMVGGHPQQMMNFQGPPPPIHHPHHQPHPQQQQAPPQMQQIHHHQPPQQQQHQPPPPPQQQQQQQQQQQHQQPQQRNLQSPVSNCSTSSSHHVLEQLRDKNNYNPLELNIDVTNLARFFVIKSYSEDDIHRSIKYEIWCSTEHGNKRLDQAFREREKEGGVIYLLFSVNGSGHFCGVAQMISAVDYNSNSTVWSQNKWKGTFKVNWIYVKDVPNPNLRHIRLENNENKSVTNSRDTQEVLVRDGQQVLRIIHAYKNSTSIFDDFVHYEKRQEEEDTKKHVDMPSRPPQQSTHYSSMQRGGGGGGNSGDYDKSNHHNSYEGGKSYGSGAGFDRNNHQGGYEKQHDGRGGSGGYNKSYGYDNNQQFGHRGGRGGDRGGGYHSYDNRRGGGDDRGYDRNSKDHHEGSAGGESSGGDYHRSNNHRGGYSRGDRSDYRREDRGGFNRNDRSDQQQHHDGGGGGGGGYNNRGHRDNHRGGDHHGQGRGRGGGGRGGGSGPHRNSQPN